MPNPSLILLRRLSPSQEERGYVISPLYLLAQIVKQFAAQMYKAMRVRVRGRRLPSFLWYLSLSAKDDTGPYNNSLDLTRTCTIGRKCLQQRTSHNNCRRRRRLPQKRVNMGGESEW